MNDFVCALKHITSTFLPGNVRQRTEPHLTAPGAPWLRAQTGSITRAESAAGIFSGGDLACDRRRAVGAAGKWPGDERGGRGSEEKEEARAAGRTNLSRAAWPRANGRCQAGMGEKSCGRGAALPACAVTTLRKKSGCGRRPGLGSVPAGNAANLAVTHFGCRVDRFPSRQCCDGRTAASGFGAIHCVVRVSGHPHSVACGSAAAGSP